MCDAMCGCERMHDSHIHVSVERPNVRLAFSYFAACICTRVAKDVLVLETS